MGKAIKNKNHILLARAIRHLLANESLDKITVEDICRDSMLSRKTFYRYFPDKYALVNYVFDELFERAYLSNNADKSWDEATTIFLNGLVSDQRYYANAYSFEGQNSLTDHDYKIFYQYYLQKCEEAKGAPLSDDEVFSLKSYCRGSVYLIAEWAKEGMFEPVNMIVHYFKVSMPETLKRFLAKE